MDEDILDVLTRAGMSRRMAEAFFSHMHRDCYQEIRTSMEWIVENPKSEFNTLMLEEAMMAITKEFFKAMNKNDPYRLDRIVEALLE